ncbi:MAG: GDSL-type esterase/lipase family protein [Kiritimatiellae bacterium]|nr:GDSL-type esterase/lipase family protein [Kiritimatiellia bacterium]
MKRLFLFSAVAVSAVAFADIRALTPQVPDSDWAKSWWQGRFDAKQKEVAEKGPKAQVVFLGDSITHFWDDAGRGREVRDAFFSGAPYNALFLGFSGDRTEHVLWRIAHGEFDGYQTKAVVLMIGTNNTGHFGFSQEPPIDTILGIKAVIDALRAKQPQARVVLLPIFPRGQTVRDPGRMRNDVVNREIVKFCDGRHVVWCDFSSKFLLPDGTLPHAIMPDYLHPGPFGYRIWAASVLPVVDACLKTPAGEIVPNVFDAHLVPGLYDRQTVNALDAQTRLEVSPDFKPNWWLERIAKNRKQISESKGEIDLVFMGDSITHYWDVGEGGDTSTEIEDLKKTYTILNCGYGGDQTQHLLWRARNGELDGYKAKLVMLMIGTNNCGQPADQVFAGIKEILKTIHAKQPQAKVLLLPIFPRGAKADDWANKSVQAVNKLIAAEKFPDHVTVFSFAEQLVDANGVTRPELYDDERLHLSDEGFKVWRKAVEPFFKAACGK